MKNLLGKTIVSIKGMSLDSEHITLTCSDGSEYAMYHNQDCCESVRVIDIIGNPEDLLNSPILMADESSNDVEETGTRYDTSAKWTFYKFATIKGYVDVRWLGESNGYYGVDVTFTQTKEPTVKKEDILPAPIALAISEVNKMLLKVRTNATYNDPSFYQMQGAESALEEVLEMLAKIR